MHNWDMSSQVVNDPRFSFDMAAARYGNRDDEPTVLENRSQ
jgi:hypothetical protein